MPLFAGLVIDRIFNVCTFYCFFVMVFFYHIFTLGYIHFFLLPLFFTFTFT